MKFRDPKTGKVFDDICSARKTFCGMWCTSCPLIIAYGTKYGCESWVRKNEEKAARLMGYEVLDKEIASKKAHWIDNADSYICSACGHEVDNPNKQTCGAGQCMYCGAYMETKEDNMNKQDKPLSEWTLGEVRKICDAHRCGECPFYSGGEPKCIVNTTPNAWNLKFTPKVPPLTGDEIAIMRAVGAKWVTHDKDSAYVALRKEKPEEFAPGHFSDGFYLGALDVNLFPSVHPGDCVEVEE